MSKFLQYYSSAIRTPSAAFKKLAADNGRLRYAFAAVTITAVLYTLVYIFLILGGGSPFKPWLDIEPELYYRYNVFFCAPSMFLGWILAAAIMHLLGNANSRSGSFEAALAASGFCLSIASWTTGIHDIITSFLGATHAIDQRHYEVLLNSATVWRTLLWIQMVLYVFTFVLLFSAAIRAIYKTSKMWAFITGTVGFIIYQSFFLIFNR